MKIFNSNRTGHIAAACFTGAWALAGAIFLGSPGVAVAAATIPIWEIIATPDVDIPTRSTRRGPWYRRLWVWWWKPYARLVSHRSKFSHSLLWGTTLRFIFGPMFWLLIPIMGDFPWVQPVASVYAQWWPWVAAGMIGADALHMVKDGFRLSEIFLGRS